MPAAAPLVQPPVKPPRQAAPGAPHPTYPPAYPVFCMPAATPFMQMMRQSSTAAL